MGVFLLLPLLVLAVVITAVLAMLRAAFRGAARSRRDRAGHPVWLVPVLLIVALILAFQGARLLSPLLVPLVMIGVGVLLLRGGPRAPRAVTVSRASGPHGAAHGRGVHAPLSTPAPAPTLLTVPSESLDARMRRLPSPAREEAFALAAEARRAATSLDERTPAEHAYTIRATLEDYLPESVNAFLEIPEARRGAPLPGGQTPVQVLLGQLRLMRDGFERAMNDQGVASAERLLAHKRFLEDRFGKPDDFKV